MPETFTIKNLLRKLAYVAYGVSLVLMLHIPYHWHDWAGVKSSLPARVLWEDMSESAFLIGLFLLICVLTQGILLAFCAPNRQERIVCVALLLLACLLWSVKAYG